VILEGWSLGFRPLEEKALVRKYAIARAEASVRGAGVDMNEGEEAEDMKVEEEGEEEYSPPAFLKQELESLVEVNTSLGEYVESWYGFFEVFIQVSRRETREMGDVVGDIGSESLNPLLRCSRSLSFRLSLQHSPRFTGGGLSKSTTVRLVSLRFS
jgi:hypothetical protein